MKSKQGVHVFKGIQGVLEYPGCARVYRVY